MRVRRSNEQEAHQGEKLPKAQPEPEQGHRTLDAEQHIVWMTKVTARGTEGKHIWRGKRIESDHLDPGQEPDGGILIGQKVHNGEFNDGIDSV
ncbi:hypothetical protein HJFPF1_11599 [Paramyrothecium foliicola]|nr:hypothetical protein HJFPF1_11599 [Paramyrothecium foliicola]